MSTGLGAASLVGILLQSVFYGIFIVLFLYNSFLQFSNYGKPSHDLKRPNPMLLSASILLFCLITAHWCINVARLYEAAITLEQRVPIDLYFANLPDPKQIATMGIFEVQVMIGDFILIYRLYHVYEKNFWVCIIPCGSWIGMAVSLGFLLKTVSNVSLETGIFIDQVKRWLSASFCLTLVTNLYCTSLIVYRLWKGHRNAAVVGVSYLRHVLQIFVESAALLAIVLLCNFILLQIGSTVQYAVLDTLGPIVGISFMLILVRLHVPKQRDGSNWGSRPTIPTGTNTRYPLDPINITVTRDVDLDYESVGAVKHSSCMVP